MDTFSFWVLWLGIPLVIVVLGKAVIWIVRDIAPKYKGRKKNWWKEGGKSK